MSAETKKALQDALQAHLAAENEDSENRVVTDFIVTFAFINLDQPAGMTGYFHECSGATHSLIGLTSIQDMWLQDLAMAEPDDEIKGY